jgi:hypothetical protein
MEFALALFLKPFLLAFILMLCAPVRWWITRMADSPMKRFLLWRIG